LDYFGGFLTFDLLHIWAAILPAEVMDKPQNKRQDDRNYDAACDGQIDTPVFGTELQIAGQLKQARSAKHYHQAAQKRYDNPHRD